MSTRRGLFGLALAGALTGCTDPSPGARSAPGPPTGRGRRTRPDPGGKAGFAGGLPATAQPTRRPAQAGPSLVDSALPTNQWWTSALTGPWTQNLWAHPLAVRLTADGLAISSAAPTATANAIVTPFIPAVTVPGPFSSVRVTDYGAFHVVLRAELGRGGSLDATVVQGSPVLYLRFHGVAPRLGPAPAGWRIQTAGDGRVAVIRDPTAADPSTWDGAVAGAAADPVTGTEARMTYDPVAGTVTQTLVAQRASGRPAVWALLPHQVTDQPKLAGHYPDALGPLAVLRAASVAVTVPLPGLLTGLPSLHLSTVDRAAVLSDVDKDLADPPGTGGSYFGLKELGRLASIVEVAEAIGAPTQRRAALQRLREQLVDWLSYQGSGDGRYFGYEGTWGGLVAVPAEFGAQDYNDHHLQYGYLVRAAAVLGAADPGFVRDYGGAVDLVVRDYAGAGSGDGPAGFPPARVFNAYSGHSMASGFAPFADGNNQESSSEAVAAWEAMVRWGLVRQRPDLVEAGLTHYALEAQTARMYWLGQGLTRPAGYQHSTAGIVWDAKVDYATWFDPKPESVQGIQLLPLTDGSTYRGDPRGRALPGAPRIWGDLFAADLALADPAAAQARLTPGLSREPSTSRAFVRYWIALLAAYGPPQPAVTVDGPYGLAFGDRAQPTLVAVNPGPDRRTVTFRRAGTVLWSVPLGPGQRAVRPGVA